MELDPVERRGQRLLAHPGLQHLDAIPVFHDPRLRGARAQLVGELSGSPVRMHVDHGALLIRSFGARCLAIYSDRERKASARRGPAKAAFFCAASTWSD